MDAVETVIEVVEGLRFILFCIAISGMRTALFHVYVCVCIYICIYICIYMYIYNMFEIYKIFSDCVHKRRWWMS